MGLVQKEAPAAETMTKVSVISTVYNGEAYFDRSVRPMLEQTHADFEWVIVDDGSNDATPRMLVDLSARDPRVRILSPGRVGRTRALNLAVEFTSGEYVANQDFDDASYPDRLKLQKEFLDAHPEVGVLGSYYVVVDEIRKERYERQPPEEHEYILRAMANRVPFSHTMVMFRKRAWQDGGGYPEVSVLKDYFLWIAIAAHGWRMANLPVSLGEHFVYKQSAFARFRSRKRLMADAQMRAIRDLGLPRWMYIFPLGRYFYASLPNPVKRFARRVLAGSRERDF